MSKACKTELLFSKVFFPFKIRLCIDYSINYMNYLSSIYNLWIVITLLFKIDNHGSKFSLHYVTPLFRNPSEPKRLTT
jgi:hypothetical protein